MTEAFDWSVAVFVGGTDGLVAVRKRSKEGGWGPWHLPGGKREPYELTVEETALRELKEETGIEAKDRPFKILGRVPRLTLKYRQGVKKPYKHYYELFFCTVTVEHVDKTTLRSIDPHEETRIIPFDEYRRMRGFSGLHRRFIRKHELIPNVRKAA